MRWISTQIHLQINKASWHHIIILRRVIQPWYSFRGFSAHPKAPLRFFLLDFYITGQTCPKTTRLEGHLYWENKGKTGAGFVLFNHGVLYEFHIVDLKRSVCECVCVMKI